MSEPSKAAAKPVFRNIGIRDLSRYRLPLAGILSILHRISGAILFLSLPFILLLLDKSLSSEAAFMQFQRMTSCWFVKLIILGLSWAYLHHLCAGIRYLLMDVHVGVDKYAGRKSAVGVLCVSLPLTALVALKLFGAF